MMYNPQLFTNSSSGEDGEDRRVIEDGQIVYLFVTKEGKLFKHVGKDGVGGQLEDYITNEGKIADVFDANGFALTIEEPKPEFSDDLEKEGKE